METTTARGYRKPAPDDPADLALLVGATADDVDADVQALAKRPAWRGVGSTNVSRSSGVVSGPPLLTEVASETFGSFPSAGSSYMRRVPEAGVYRVTGRVTFQAAANGTRSLDLKTGMTSGDPSSGTTIDRDQQPGSSASLTSLQVSATVRLAANDTVGLSTLQTSGAAVDLIGTAYQAWLSIQKVSE